MPTRSEKRDPAKAAYIERRQNGIDVNLREFAEEMGVAYNLLRRWKSQDKWDEGIKRKRGGQPGNQNSKGKKNAKGNHGGAPVGNKNAEKDGAYSRIFFDQLTEEEMAFVAATPTESGEALRHEMQILKLREKKILDAIAKYEKAPEDELYIDTVLDMREPAGRGEKKKDGAKQKMGMYNKQTPFARIVKLQEALTKIHGRIATIAAALRQEVEFEQRIELERQRLEIMRMRATGSIEVPDEETEADFE